MWIKSLTTPPKILQFTDPMVASQTLRTDIIEWNTILWTFPLRFESLFRKTILLELFLTNTDVLCNITVFRLECPFKVYVCSLFLTKQSIDWT